MKAKIRAEAARQLGYKSRSQLYRLIEEGSLRDYVYQDQKGRTYLLAEPEGKIIFIAN